MDASKRHSPKATHRNVHANTVHDAPDNISIPSRLAARYDGGSQNVDIANRHSLAIAAFCILSRIP
jgi:hypothetical protein